MADPISVFAMCIHQKLLKDGCAACGYIGNRQQIEEVKQLSEIEILIERINKLEQRIVDLEDRQKPELYNE